MSTDVKDHYDNHLSYVYSWMMGNFEIKSNEFKKILIDNDIIPNSNKIVFDLGAGHGLQSIALAEMGFNVFSVDFNQLLIDQLKLKANTLNISTIRDDIRNVVPIKEQPELIVCCGDTLSHLDSEQDVICFIGKMIKSLCSSGKMILSFRDYSITLKNEERFILVKSDDNRIMTCFLDYYDDYVIVTDIIHEKITNGWNLKTSSYKKVRLFTDTILRQLEQCGMTIKLNQMINGLTTIISTKRKEIKHNKI